MIKKIIQNYPKQINSILLFEYASIPGSRGWAEEIKESKLPKEKVAQVLGELNGLCKEAGIPFIPQKFAASIPEKSRRTA